MRGSPGANSWASFLRREGILIVGILGIAGVVLSGERPLREVIDECVESAWQREKVDPASPATDEEFLRRVYLDLCGTIPSYEEAVGFLKDPAPAKRQQLVERLLEDPRFARHQAEIWDRILFSRNPPATVRSRRGIQRWLREQFAANTPYDQMVLALLKAKGNSFDHGPPLYLAQWRNNPESTAEQITETFLGVQLQCARCHDHPYEPWTQTDFYGMAAFFARLEVVTLGKAKNETKYAIGEKNRGEVLFAGPAAEQEPGKKGQPVQAKFLQGQELDEPELSEDVQDPRRFPNNKMPPAPKFSRKDALAEWVASPGNPFFANAIANRLWAQFLGRGIVHPVTHMSPSNPPSHPALLDALADHLVKHNFDLKDFIRELVNSRTYQLSSAGEVPAEKPFWFQRARYRPLSAEELVTSWRVATGYDAALLQAGQEIPEDRFHGITGDYVKRFFGTPTTGEGDFQGGLQEHLYLNNGQLPRLIVDKPGSLLQTLRTSSEPWQQRVERLFMTVLTRHPDAQETAYLTQFLSEDDDARLRLQEAIWSLLTCSEFRFNH